MFYSIEFLMNASTIVFTLARFNQLTKYMLKVELTKYMLKVAKEMLAKDKTSPEDVNVILVFNLI